MATLELSEKSKAPLRSQGSECYVKLAFSVFLYVGESWTLKSKITAKDPIIRHEILQTHPRYLLRRPHQKMSQCETTSHKNRGGQKMSKLRFKKQKLKCYGHITNVNNLSVAILQDTTLGKRRGNQMKKRSGNVSEQTVRSLNRDILKEGAR